MSHDPVIFETTVAPPVVFETTIVPPKSYPTTIQVGVQGRKGEAGGGGQTFDQDLNTTDSPMFAEVTASTFKGKNGATNSYGSPGSVGGKIYLDGAKRGDQADGNWIAGTPGSIDLRGGGTNDVDDTGNGGNITMRGSNGSGGDAGLLDTSSYGYGVAGGSIETWASGKPGGFLKTSDGGGSIDTTGTGYLGLGDYWVGTQTLIYGQASTNRALAFPDADGQIALTTDAPSAHKSSHATGGIDALTPADIGAAAASHTHTASAITDFAASVRAVVITGLSTSTHAAIAATDTVLGALGKLQAQVTALASAGYQTAAQVTTAITSYGYQTASQVTTAITSYGYQTASQVTTAITTALTNATLSGTNNTAPSQTASSSSSLMTRLRVDERVWQSLDLAKFTVAGSYFTPGTVSSGVSGQNGGNFRLNTSASVASSVAWATMLGAVGSPINSNNQGGGGSNLSWNKKWAITFQIGRPYVSTNTSFDFRITTNASSTTPLYTIAGTENGIGFKMYGVLSGSTNTANFQAYSGNGTSVTYATAITSRPIDDIIPLRIYNDGAGTVTLEFFKIGTGWVTIGSVNRPISTGGGYAVQIIAINNGTAAERIDIPVLGGCNFWNLDIIS